MKYYQGHLILVFLVSLTACEEAVLWDLQSGENGQLVVDAILTNENRLQEVRLSLSYAQLNEKATLIGDAIVVVSSSDDRFVFNAQHQDPGLYQSQVPFAARKDVTYLLEINWNNEIYTASSQLSFVSPLEKISFQAVEGGDRLSIGEVASIYHPLEQAMYEVDIDWRHLIPVDSSQAKLFFYTFSTVDGNEFVRPPVESIDFPRGSVVMVTKYGLSVSFADYLRTLNMETNWHGGAFDEASSSLPTNLSNHALGFFSVCAVLTDTVIAR